MNAIFISDTYGQHESILLPQGNIIIHAGNFTKTGTELEAKDFLQWFSQLPYEHKIFIAGTHDHFFERDPERARQAVPSNVIYLEDSGVVIGGFKIWGSPYNLYNHGSAFSCTEAEIGAHWDRIPFNVDMVISHSPAYGLLDINGSGEHEGCKVLLRRLVRVEPRYVVCGHAVDGHGHEYYDGIHFINAAMGNQEFQLSHKPVFQWYPN
jgi:Icc-related predicted phosphoesterase